MNLGVEMPCCPRMEKDSPRFLFILRNRKAFIHQKIWLQVPDDDYHDDGKGNHLTLILVKKQLSHPGPQDTKQIQNKIKIKRDFTSKMADCWNFRQTKINKWK